VSNRKVQKRKYQKGFFQANNINNNNKANVKKADDRTLADKTKNLRKAQKESENIQNHKNYNYVLEVSDNSLMASTDDSFLTLEENLTIPSNYYDNTFRTKVEQKLEKSKNKLQKKINKNVKKIKTSNSVNEGEPKTEGLGLAGFISGVVGLAFFGVLFGTIAIIFGAISLGKINKNPGEYKGKGFALTSLILGIIDVLAFLIILAIIL
tara:strand:- start:937 stop:1563 length:627 start_codon:yes stop_codon:yes gene_type:complete